MRPGPDEYAAYFGRYIERVPDGPLVDTLRQQGAATAARLRGLDPALAGHRYAPGRWTISQSIGHLIDTERIFGVRALRIARGDATPQPGFDQDAYAEDLPPARPLADLADEFERLRASTVDVFVALDDEALVRQGTASGNPLTARAAGWIIAGHELHHLAILRDRYLAV